MHRRDAAAGTALPSSGSVLPSVAETIAGRSGEVEPAHPHPAWAMARSPLHIPQNQRWVAVAPCVAVRLAPARRGTPSAETARARLRFSPVTTPRSTIPPSAVHRNALVVASEVGCDLSRFPDSQHFCSWATLAPPTNISGGKHLANRNKRKSVNRVGEALKIAATNARRDQKTIIGAAHRARLVRLDNSVAIKATANQLARIIYAMISKAEPYIVRGTDELDARRIQNQRRHLERRARALGLELVEQNDPKKSVA